MTVIHRLSKLLEFCLFQFNADIPVNQVYFSDKPIGNLEDQPVTRKARELVQRSANAKEMEGNKPQRRKTKNRFLGMNIYLLIK